MARALISPLLGGDHWQTVPMLSETEERWEATPGIPLLGTLRQRSALPTTQSTDVLWKSKGDAPSKDSVGHIRPMILGLGGGLNVLA